MPSWMPSCPTSAGGALLLEVLDGDVELRGVDYAIALELHPDTIHALARKVHVELHLGAAVGDEGMGVNHVDQVVTGGEHMAPCAYVLLNTLGGLEVKEHHRLLARD